MRKIASEPELLHWLIAYLKSQSKIESRHEVLELESHIVQLLELHGGVSSRNLIDWQESGATTSPANPNLFDDLLYSQQLRDCWSKVLDEVLDLQPDEQLSRSDVIDILIDGAGLGAKLKINRTKEHVSYKLRKQHRRNLGVAIWVRE